MYFELPNLGYPYGALEPFIDTQTMKTHHTKHQQTYVNNANKALEGYPEWQDKSAPEILSNTSKIPEEIRAAVTNNVGGVCNHNFFWLIMSPNGGGEPNELLGKAINNTFGNFENFKTEFKKAALGQFGSGWTWLVMKDGKLSILSTSNQDSPVSIGYKRIITIDVWEHAYYLNYQNRRADYIDAFWSVVNWKKAEENYLKALE